MTEVKLPTLPQADMLADDIYGNPTEWYSRESVLRLLIQNDHEAYVRGVQDMGKELRNEVSEVLE